MIKHDSNREQTLAARLLYKVEFKVVVRACYEAYVVVHVFRYLAPICFRETCMMLSF